MKYLVVKGWTASYADPIAVSAGNTLELDGRQDNWDGHIWLWAKSTSGREGWVPDTLVMQGEIPTARHDYCALELTCKTGEMVTAETQTHGWVLCKSQSGKCGWVPLKNLAPANDSTF